VRSYHSFESTILVLFLLGIHFCFVFSCGSFMLEPRYVLPLNLQPSFFFSCLGFFFWIFDLVLVYVRTKIHDTLNGWMARLSGT
jgi:hypothetical protein